MVAVVFTRGRRWYDARTFGAQDDLRGHIDFIRRNRDSGVVIEGGPLHELDTYVTDEFVGLALLDMDSLEDAREFINADPVVQTRVFAYRLYLWGDAALRR